MASSKDTEMQLLTTKTTTSTTDVQSFLNSFKTNPSMKRENKIKIFD